MQVFVKILLAFDLGIGLEHGALDYPAGNMVRMPGNILLWHQLQPVEEPLGRDLNSDVVS